MASKNSLICLLSLLCLLILSSCGETEAPIEIKIKVFDVAILVQNDKAQDYRVVLDDGGTNVYDDFLLTVNEVSTNIFYEYEENGTVYNVRATVYDPVSSNNMGSYDHLFMSAFNAPKFATRLSDIF